MDWKVLAIQPVVYTDFQNVELLHIYGLVPEQQDWLKDFISPSQLVWKSM